MIVVIDGLAGSGKSSTARAVANRLGIEYLDSGALYRALAVVYLETGENLRAFFELLKTLTVSFRYEDKTFHVFVNGRDVTEQLRTEEVANVVSLIASKPEVRTFINDLMRKAVKRGQYIAEGRDLGTAVFPEAELKFYMSADVDERARRRFEQLKEQEPDITLEEVRSNIIRRDQKDSRRKSDPLRKAGDAIEIDTTDTTFEQQVNKICSMISEATETKH